MVVKIELQLEAIQCPVDGSISSSSRGSTLRTFCCKVAGEMLEVPRWMTVVAPVWESLELEVGGVVEVAVVEVEGLVAEQLAVGLSR